MKFKFTKAPLKDLPLGSVVDSYCITERSHTGKNAIAYRCTDKETYNGYRVAAVPAETVLLIHVEDEYVTEHQS